MWAGAEREPEEVGKSVLVTHANSLPRTLVYLEGDATMRTYDDADGKKQTSLSLVQTKIEVLKRPTPSTEDAADGGALGV